MYIKKKDKVYILAGKDKGKTGEVLQCISEKNRAVISKINLVKRHTRAKQNEPGGIHEKEASVHVSNLQLVCVSCEKHTRIRCEKLPDGKKVRICKKCGEIII